MKPRGLGVTAALEVPGEWLTPRRAAPDAALLFLHGGGYAIGSARTHRAPAGWLALRIGIAALVPDYRRAPGSPHPAALTDSAAAYESLLAKGIPSERIAVAGDSAGGGLTLALAFLLRERGLPLPAVLGLICPWLDLAPDLDGTRRCTPRAPLLSPALLRSWATMYTRGADPTTPAVSPLNGDMRGLPPIVVHSAQDDPLMPDAERLVAAVREVGGSIEHRHDHAMWHDFHIFGGVLARADEALADLGARLRERIFPGWRAQSSASTSWAARSPERIAPSM